MTCSDVPRAGIRAAVYTRNGEISGAGDDFTGLTGYSRHEVLGRRISEVLQSALRFSSASYAKLTTAGSAGGYIFTASGAACEVTVTAAPQEDGGVLYLMEARDTGIDKHISALEALFEGEFMSAALYSVPEYLILKTNKSYSNFLGQAYGITGDILGREVLAHAPACRLLLDAVATSGKISYMSETKHVGADGQEMYRTYSFQPVSVDGKVKYIIETSVDATERVQARLLRERYLAEIKLQKEKLEAIIENLSDPLIIIDGEGRYEKLNRAARDVFGRNVSSPLRKVGDIAGTGNYSDFSGNIITLEKSPGWRLLHGESFHHYELEALPDDSPYYYDVSGTAIHNESGEFVSGILYCRDITEHFSHKKQMAEKNRLLTAVIENMQDALVIYDHEGRISFVNARARAMYPHITENATVMTVHDSTVSFNLNGQEIPPENLPSRRVIQGEEIRNECIIIRHRDWTKVVEVSATPIFDESGKLVSAVVIHHDITERKMMEDALMESEKNYRLATEGSGAGVYAYDFIRNKGYWSAQYRAILGISPDEQLVIDNDYTFTRAHPEDRDRLIAALTRANEPGSGGVLDLHYRIVRPDQTVRWVHAKGQTFFSGQGEDLRPYLSAGAITDETEDKAIGDQIRKVSEELTNIIESTDDFIWSIDRDHRIIFCNTAARNHFRDHFGQSLGNIDKMTDILPHIALSFADQPQQNRRAERLRFDLRTPIGGRIVSYTYNPVIIDGEFSEVTVFGKDITERLNTEREIIRLNASLEERVAERTAQLQQTVSDLKNIALIFSHDLTSALRGIGVYAGEILGGKDIPENAKRIRTTHLELQTMVEGLLNYEKSSWSAISKEYVNIKKMIVSAFGELNAGADPKGILEFETGLPPVIADGASLRHVILNILSNALKFALPGRTPRLVVGCRAEESFYVIYFKDNGIGFDMSNSEKIFGVFERLHSKSAYEGSGVGLAIVRNIIQRHGGRVWADSEPGIGTTFYIALPINAIEGDPCIK